MTKREAEDHFRQYVLPHLGEDGADYAMRSEAWLNFTDGLCKDGEITLRQYEGWDHPKFCYSPKELREKRSRRMRIVHAIMES